MKHGPFDAMVESVWTLFINVGPEACYLECLIF